MEKTNVDKFWEKYPKLKGTTGDTTKMKEFNIAICKDIIKQISSIKSSMLNFSDIQARFLPQFFKSLGFKTLEEGIEKANMGIYEIIRNENFKVK